MERYNVKNGQLFLNGSALPIPPRTVLQVLSRHAPDRDGAISSRLAEEIIEEARIEANAQLRRYLRAALS